MSSTNKEPYIYKAVVTKIVDGDTVYMDADLGFSITMALKVRLARINAAETRGPDKVNGKRVKAWLADYMPVGSKIVLESLGIGKYGRVIGELYYNDVNISDELLKDKSVVPYK